MMDCSGRRRKKKKKKRRRSRKYLHKFRNVAPSSLDLPMSPLTPGL
jgi:hypothetical protein